MIRLFLFIIPFFLISIKIILYLIVKKYGKISYDGFSAAGFAYDSHKNIFYSTKNAWQKNFGYTHTYDVLAPIFMMIVDTEPVRFYYHDKNWLITFWKGQYGIVTGAEIGIYCTDQKKVNKKTLYLPVKDSEMLKMNFILYRKGKVIGEINAKHWWLTIFKLGMFSKPKDLTMDINITFLDEQMLEAFLKSFMKLGYTSKDFKVENKTFCFKYIKPHTHKVWTRSWLGDAIRQFFNQKNVELYNNYLEDLIDDNKIDDSRTNNNKKLIMINEYIPDILKNAPQKNNHLEDIKYEKNAIYLNSSVYSEIE